MLRDVLRSIDPLYRLNARIRAASVRHHYSVQAASYSRLVCARTPLVAAKLRQFPHICFMGTDELQDRAGIIQALESLGRVSVFTRATGHYGQNDPDLRQRASRNAERLLHLFSECARRNEVPDVLIAQTWADYVLPQALADIKRRYNTVIINIGMDDRHRWSAIRPLIPVLDLALTAAPECVEWYEKEGCPARFFPEASDPTIYYPMPDLPKIHDVSFVGGRYGIREKIVTALRRAGIRVTAYGTGWEAGRLPLDETPRLFAQSKIVLGVGTIGHCSDFYTLKMRDFDGPMSGSLYLTHHNPDLTALYEVGNEIATYSTLSECVDRARHYLAHPQERERVAAAGRARALADHTWRRRFSELFRELQ